jgi:hypothetical protein
MNRTEKPPLSLEVEHQIEVALNQIHADFWPRLEKMQEFTSEARDTYRRIAPHKVPSVPAPRSPNALKVLLGQYATALFESEAIRYPNDQALPYWLQKLEERVTSTVLNRVAQVCPSPKLYPPGIGSACNPPLSSSQLGATGWLRLVNY